MRSQSSGVTSEQIRHVKDPGIVDQNVDPAEAIQDGRYRFWGPVLLSALKAKCSPSISRRRVPQTATLAPALPRAVAQAAPMPREPPVTRAILPSTRNGIAAAFSEPKVIVIPFLGDLENRHLVGVPVADALDLNPGSRNKPREYRDSRR